MTLNNVKRTKTYHLLKKALGYSDYWPIKSVGRNKTIFIHIPKNAGTSIGPKIGYQKRIHYPLDEFGNPTKKNLTNLKNTLRHWDSKDVHQFVGEKRWGNSFKFSIVRNPWDRMYSWYKYKKLINHHLMKVRPIDFNDWINALFEEKNPFYFHNPKMYQSQFEWLSLDGNSISIDYVCKFETLKNDFEKVADILEIDSSLDHFNKSQEGNAKSHYNSKSIDLVAKHFYKDIDYWEYKFE